MGHQCIKQKAVISYSWREFIHAAPVRDTKKSNSLSLKEQEHVVWQWGEHVFVFISTAKIFCIARILRTAKILSITRILIAFSSVALRWNERSGTQSSGTDELIIHQRCPLLIEAMRSKVVLAIQVCAKCLGRDMCQEQQAGKEKHV